MRRVPAALFAAGLALAGCGGGQAELDIVEIEPATSAMLPGGAAVDADAVAMDVLVRSGQLRSLLNRRGAVDLLVFDCDAPDGPGETIPVYFGGEPIAGIAGRQVSDNPEMLVLLNAVVPGSALEPARPCARFVGRPGPFAPQVTSRPMELERE
jgi:hypothetical protein